MRVVAIAVATTLAMVASPAAAVTCTQQEYQDNSYSLCEADMSADQLRLFLKNGAGQTYGYFSAVEQALEAKGQRLGFADERGDVSR